MNNEDYQSFEFTPKAVEQLGDENATLIDLNIAETKTPNGNLLLTRLPGSNNRLMMFEYLQPYVRPDTSYDYNLKFPMFIVAFVVVVIY